MIHAFDDSLPFARRLGRALGRPVRRVRVHAFPDRESLVRVAASAGRSPLLVRSLHEPNAKLVEVLLAADALRRAGARRVTLVSPYLPYMRQDRVFRAGEPVSQQVIGDLLGAAFERVVTVEPHLHRVRSLREVVGRGGRAVQAAPALAAWVARRRAGLLVGPDEESEGWIRATARRAGLPFCVGRKQRLGDRAVRVRFAALPPVRRAVIVDDVASSGATLAAAARGLRRAGIAEVDVAVVHAIFTRGALARVARAGVERVVSCDTIPHPTNAIRVAALVARVLT